MSFKGCISCRKCKFIRGNAFCWTDKLTEKQLYNDKEYCSDFEDKTQPKKPSLWWKCERCGKLIPYMADFCYECADELLGEPPKPFEPQEGAISNDSKRID